jgi:hypothetical protein
MHQPSSSILIFFCGFAAERHASEDIQPLAMHKQRLGLILIGLCVFSGTVVAQTKRATSGHATAPVYVVSKPTLISSIVVTPAEVDSSGDLNEALSDYEWYIGRAIAVLKPHGVEVYVTNDSTVRWRDRLGTHSMSASDSGGVLYLFVSPNGRTRILRNGVQIDDAILDAARQLFGPMIPPPEHSTEKP